MLTRFERCAAGQFPRASDSHPQSSRRASAVPERQARAANPLPFAVTIQILDVRILTDPKTAVDARTEMLSKLPVELRAYDADLSIRSNEHPLSRRRLRNQPPGNTEVAESAAAPANRPRA